MKNIKENKMKLHIYLIVITILMLSLISWVYFLQKNGSVLKSYLTESLKLMTTVQDIDETNSSCEKVRHKFIDISNSLNGVVDKVDTMWTIYKQSVFSKIDSIATYFVTGEISSLKVVGGKEGWLFYGMDAKPDVNPIGDYEGTNSYTQNEINEAYDATFWVQQNMQNRGIEFAILVPPNKENIYSEYMPDTYIHSEQSRTDYLIDYLSNSGINIVSPKKELLENHDDFQLYYSYDTHWNQLGAYIGVKDTLQTWGFNMPELSQRTISNSELRREYHYCGEDDLAKMLGMRFIFSDEIEYTVDGTELMDWKNFQAEQENSEVSSFHNDMAAIEATILIIGDSFRVSMIPSLREKFSDVYVVHIANFASDMIDEIQPDYMIVEYVERYSSDIKNIDKLFE